MLTGLDGVGPERKCRQSIEVKLASLRQAQLSILYGLADSTTDDDMQRMKEKNASCWKIREKSLSPPTGPDEDSRLISAATLAQMLDISLRTLWRLKSGGKLPQPVKLGGSVRWRAAEIADWVAASCPGMDEWNIRNGT